MLSLVLTLRNTFSCLFLSYCDRVSRFVMSVNSTGAWNQWSRTVFEYHNSTDLKAVKSVNPQQPGHFEKRDKKFGDTRPRSKWG